MRRIYAFYFRAPKFLNARRHDEQYVQVGDRTGFIRVEEIEEPCGVDNALDKCKPREGETVLNTVLV